VDRGVFERKKLQAPNNKQYPNSKLQKIPLTPFRKGETGLDLPEEFSSV
jgi:hypothetical protein